MRAKEGKARVDFLNIWKAPLSYHPIKYDALFLMDKTPVERE